MIQLTEKLAVTADKYQYIVGTPRQRARRSGEALETTLDDPAYCKTLAQALRVAVSSEMKRGVYSGEIQTLRAFAQHLEKITADFEAKISKFEV